MRAGFNGWWFLPFGIITASALIALEIVVFQPSFVDRSFAGVAQLAGIETTINCSGGATDDYSCYQERYQALVRGSGVEAAFAELKDEYDNNGFVKTNCHQLTHVIGRAAVDIYGDLSGTYAHGDSFCRSGYYHGAMQAVVAKIGPDRILEEANAICADLGEHQRYSFYHYNCVHGLGHGFMGVLDNELFESLKACDALVDEWERTSCHGGVFMENIIAGDNPGYPTKYLKPDQPLYPCTDVEDEYKTPCYGLQTSYALYTQDDDFAKVFELCGEVEEAYRPTCYQSLGRDASSQSRSDVAETEDSCMLGEDHEARSNCVVGAVKDFISYYHTDTKARELCESFEEADLRSLCLETGEEYYKSIQT